MNLLRKQMSAQYFHQIAADADDLRDHQPDDITAEQAIRGTALINWVAGVLDAVNGVYMAVPDGVPPHEIIAVSRDHLDAQGIMGDPLDKPMVFYLIEAVSKRWPGPVE